MEKLQPFTLMLGMRGLCVCACVSVHVWVTAKLIVSCSYFRGKIPRFSEGRRLAALRWPAAEMLKPSVPWAYSEREHLSLNKAI